MRAIMNKLYQYLEQELDTLPMQKRASLSTHSRDRLTDIVEDIHMSKQANVFAKAVGYGAQGVGKALQTPAIGGAAVGALGGAVAAGEGNRLEGALAGGLIGAGGAYGLSQVAPKATKGIQTFGRSLTSAGRSAVTRGNMGVDFSRATKNLQNLSMGTAGKNMAIGAAGAGALGMTGGAIVGRPNANQQNTGQ